MMRDKISRYGFLLLWLLWLLHCLLCFCFAFCLFFSFSNVKLALVGNDHATVILWPSPVSSRHSSAGPGSQIRKHRSSGTTSSPFQSNTHSVSLLLCLISMSEAFKDDPHIRDFRKYILRQHQMDPGAHQMNMTAGVHLDMCWVMYRVPGSA